MKLIVFLGNKGEEYKFTRHNAGFLCADYLQKKWEFPEFEKKVKFNGKISEGILNGEKIIFLKPLTYMNLSGTSVQKIMDFYKIDPEDLLVIFDDKDMEFGSVRFRKKGSDGGHRGIRSLINCLGTDNFARIKIGIDSEDRKGTTADFVLSSFTEEELEYLLKEVFWVAEEMILEWA